jgi:hypothetical protein
VVIDVLPSTVEVPSFQMPFLAPSSPGHSAGSQYYVLSSNLFFSTKDCDWIQRRSGESASFSLLSPTGPPWQRDRQQSLALSFDTTIVDLPEKPIVEQYLQLFRGTPFRLVFPVVDTVLFQETIDSAYKQGDSSIISSACVFCFVSIMSHTQWTLRSIGIVDGDVCAKQAELLIGRLVTLEANIVGLQIYIMLCIYQLFSGNLQVASIYHAISCRILFMLGGHVCNQTTLHNSIAFTGTDHERRTKDQLRKLFWLCYTFDKVLSLRTGQPPCIDDKYCDLTLPVGYADMLYNVGDFESGPATTLCFFPGDLRLSIIKSRTCKLLYATQSPKLSHAELLQIVRELDCELETWRMSIPLEYRPTLSSKVDRDGFNPAMDSTQRMHIVIIHLEYQHLVATIHGTTSRSFGWNRKNSVNQGLEISSSQALSVEASRACLIYLRVAAHALIGPTFW